MLRASLFHLPNKKQEAATEKLFSDLDREKEEKSFFQHLEAWREWQLVEAGEQA